MAQQARTLGQLVRVALPGLNSRGFGEHRICATVKNGEQREPRLREVIREMKSQLAGTLHTKL